MSAEGLASNRVERGLQAAETRARPWSFDRTLPADACCGVNAVLHALDASPRAVCFPLIALLAWLLLPGSAGASSADALKQYESGRYDAALKEYDRLRAQRPEDSRLAFNAGAAAYQAKKFEDATRHFSSATGARDPLLAQSAFYNLGNAYFQTGEGAADPAQKQEAWQGAIGFYDTALKLRPEDADAKHNRDFVQRKLEELKKEQEKSKDNQKPDDKQGDQKDDKNKQDQKQPDDQKKDDQKKQDQKQDQQKQDGKKPEDSKPDEKKQDQQQKQPEKPGDQKPPEPKKPENQPGQQKQGQKGDQGDPESGQATALGQMTAAQAMQLLDSQRNEERALIFLPTNAVQKANNRVFKNW